MKTFKEYNNSQYPKMWLIVALKKNKNNFKHTNTQIRKCRHDSSSETSNLNEFIACVYIHLYLFIFSLCLLFCTKVRV